MDGLLHSVRRENPEERTPAQSHQHRGPASAPGVSARNMAAGGASESSTEA